MKPFSYNVYLHNESKLVIKLLKKSSFCETTNHLSMYVMSCCCKDLLIHCCSTAGLLLLLWLVCAICCTVSHRDTITVQQ